MATSSRLVLLQRACLLNTLLPALRRPPGDVDDVLRQPDGVAHLIDHVHAAWRSRLCQLQSCGWQTGPLLDACRRCAPALWSGRPTFACRRWRICPWCFSRTIGGGLLAVLAFSDRLVSGTLALSETVEVYPTTDASEAVARADASMRAWRLSAAKRFRGSLGYWGFGSLVPADHETAFRFRIFAACLTPKAVSGDLAFSAGTALANVDKAMSLAAYPAELLSGSSPGSAAVILGRESRARMRFSGGVLRGLSKKFEPLEPGQRVRPYTAGGGQAGKSGKVTIVGSPERIQRLKAAAAERRESLTAAVWRLIDAGEEALGVRRVRSSDAKPARVSSEFAAACAEALAEVEGGSPPD